jgi:hypothetical protein
MMKYDFTDLAHTQIFVYSFETGKEYQLPRVKQFSSSSPVFMQKGSDKWVIIWLLNAF